MLPFSQTATRPPVAALAFALLVCAAERGTASPPKAASMARLDVIADASCTTRADLMARVRSRVPRVTFGDEPEALRVRAKFSTSRMGVVTAELELMRPASASSARRVVARSCAEAADAAALIIAITLDPASSGRAAPNSSGPTGEASNPESPPPASSMGPSTATAMSAASAPSPAPKSPSPDEKSPGRPADNRADLEAVDRVGNPAPGSSSLTRAFFGLALAGEGVAGPAPGLMPGVGVFVSAGLERPALWSPSVLIGATHAWRSRVREEGGDASFMLDAASFDACPWRLQLAPIDVRPCASVLVGRFAVRGTRTQNAAPESARPFWVLGGAVLGSVKLVWLLEAQVRIAFGANLVRDSFEFAPVVFHRVGPASFTTSAGIGVHLP